MNCILDNSICSHLQQVVEDGGGVGWVMAAASARQSPKRHSPMWWALIVKPNFYTELIFMIFFFSCPMFLFHEFCQPGRFNQITGSVLIFIIPFMYLILTVLFLFLFFPFPAALCSWCPNGTDNTHPHDEGPGVSWDRLGGSGRGGDGPALPTHSRQSCPAGPAGLWDPRYWTQPLWNAASHWRRQP